MPQRKSSAKKEQAELTGQLRAAGKTWAEIAEILRLRYRVNARVAFRLAHGLTQEQVAEIWNARWPDERAPRTSKNVSYWERWPSATGHQPSLSTLNRLAEIYQCSVSDLLTDCGDHRHLDAAFLCQPSEVAEPEAPSVVERSRADEVQWLTLSATETHGAAHVDADYIQAIRESIEYFIALDGRYGGNAILPLAVRTFRAAHGNLGAAGLRADVECDLAAATGQIGQVAAWLAYDADRQSMCRHIIHEALLTSQLAGDRDTELLELDHLVMQSLHLRRPRAATQIIDGILADQALPPRVAALLDIRRARAFAQCGDRQRALAAFGKAGASLADGITARDPHWTWWIDDAELTWHRAMAFADLGEWMRAVPLFKDAADLRIGNRREQGVRYRRAGYNDAVHLLNALVRVEAWRDAERIIVNDVAPHVTEVDSRRTANLLLRIFGRIQKSRDAASSTLVDSASELREFLSRRPV
jgi:transcriptional regulator with XRE-family HTH domain